MKVLLVDNGSDTWDELHGACVDAGLEVTALPCRQVDVRSADGFDAVVLSGGWWYDDEIQHLEIYKGELELIRYTTVPIVGICIGMQLMQIAHSGQVQLLDEPQYGLRTISLGLEGQALLGWPSSMQVHKNHTMGALAAADGFDVLGRSPGHVEIIVHQQKPLLGVQFHPEVGSREEPAVMVRQLIEASISLTQRVAV